MKTETSEQFDMKGLTTVKSLVEFIEAIPEEQWCINTFERNGDGITQRCVAGHINHHLSGISNHWIDSTEPATILLNKLNISRPELVFINNTASNPKKAVLDYLNTLKS